MIKAATRLDNGKVILLFGLSHRNLDELKKDRPINIDLGELGIDIEGSVLIFTGKTEQAMEEWLQRKGITFGEVKGSICQKCGSGRRDDGTCDCKESQNESS